MKLLEDCPNLNAELMIRCITAERLANAMGRGVEEVELFLTKSLADCDDESLSDIAKVLNCDAKYLYSNKLMEADPYLRGTLFRMLECDLLSRIVPASIARRIIDTVRMPEELVKSYAGFKNLAILKMAISKHAVRMPDAVAESTSIAHACTFKRAIAPLVTNSDDSESKTNRLLFGQYDFSEEQWNAILDTIAD